MGLNALLIIYNGPSSLTTIKKYEWLYISIGFLFPLPFALYPLLQTNNVVPFYGDADQWCWFSKQNSIYGIYLWFAILWIVFLSNLICLVLTARHFSIASKTLNSPFHSNARLFVLIVAFLKIKNNQILHLLSEE